MKINPEPECEKKPMRKNQKDWTQHFNNKGIKMVSVPDIHQVTKEGDKEIITSLRKDFEDSWVVTSTRITYNKDNLNAKITHDADSKVVKPKTINVKVPEFSGDFKEDSETEKYLQALFNTKDKLKTILVTLKKLGQGKTIRLWTPSQSSRADRPVRSVGLYFSYDGFNVDGDDWIGYGGGLARGVLSDSAKRSKSKRKGR